MESFEGWGREMLAAVADLSPAIHWVVVGGESGPSARPMRPDWARSLRDQCAAADVSFFFKQWGEYVDVEQMPESTAVRVDAAHNLAGNPQRTWKVGKKAAGRLLDECLHNEIPQSPALEVV